MKKILKKKKKEIIMNKTHGKDDLTPDVKRVAESIAQICLKWGQVHLAEQIRIDYGLKDVKRMDLDKESIFYQLAKKNNIRVNQQGWVREGDQMFPLVSIDYDIRELDKFIINVLDNNNKLSNK